MPIANYTIDDSQWSTPALALSAGWNMLREGGSNEYIDPDQVEIMSPLLDQFWNKSVSWTTKAGSTTTLQFIGTDIWAYGLGGPDQGGYGVNLDDKAIGSFTAISDDADYKYLLYAAHGLKDGVVHTLVLSNEDEGQSLAFDYAIVQSGSQDLSVPSMAFPLSSSTSPSPSPTSLKASSTGLGGIFQPSSATSSGNSSGLGDLTGGAQAAGLVPPQTTWSASQLAALAQPYKFHWNSASYFVVVFSILVILAFLIGTVYHFIGSWRGRKMMGMGMSLSRGGKGEGSVQDGESYLITGSKRPRPNTKILDALKKGKISNPVPSDDGHSNRRSSYGTGEGSGVSYDYHRGEGW